MRVQTIPQERYDDLASDLSDFIYDGLFNKDKSLISTFINATSPIISAVMGVFAAWPYYSKSKALAGNDPWKEFRFIGSSMGANAILTAMFTLDVAEKIKRYLLRSEQFKHLADDDKSLKRKITFVVTIIFLAIVSALPYYFMALDDKNQFEAITFELVNSVMHLFAYKSGLENPPELFKVVYQLARSKFYDKKSLEPLARIDTAQRMMGDILDKWESQFESFIKEYMHNPKSNDPRIKRLIELLIYKMPDEKTSLLKAVAVNDDAPRNHNQYIADILSTLSAQRSIELGPWQKFVNEHIKYPSNLFLSTVGQLFSVLSLMGYVAGTVTNIQKKVAAATAQDIGATGALVLADIISAIPVSTFLFLVMRSSGKVVGTASDILWKLVSGQFTLPIWLPAWLPSSKKAQAFTGTILFLVLGAFAAYLSQSYPTSLELVVEYLNDWYGFLKWPTIVGTALFNGSNSPQLLEALSLKLMAGCGMDSTKEGLDLYARFNQIMAYLKDLPEDEFLRAVDALSQEIRAAEEEAQKVGAKGTQKVSFAANPSSEKNITSAVSADELHNFMTKKEIPNKYQRHPISVARFVNYVSGVGLKVTEDCDDYTRPLVKPFAWFGAATAYAFMTEEHINKHSNPSTNTYTRL